MLLSNDESNLNYELNKPPTHRYISTTKPPNIIHKHNIDKANTEKP